MLNHLGSKRLLRIRAQSWRFGVDTRTRIDLTQKLDIRSRLPSIITTAQPANHRDQSRRIPVPGDPFLASEQEPENSSYRWSNVGAQRRKPKTLQKIGGRIDLSSISWRGPVELAGILVTDAADPPLMVQNLSCEGVRYRRATSEPEIKPDLPEVALGWKNDRVAFEQSR